MNKGLTVVCAALVFVGLQSGAAWGKELKFAIFSPPQSMTVTRVAEPWAEWLKEQSAGDLEIKVYSGGTLGRNPAQQLRLVETGVADVAWIVPSYTSSRFPELSVFELPGLVGNAVEGSQAIWKMFEDGELSGFEGVKVLALYTTDTYNLHLANPLASLDELKGKRLRSGGPVQNSIISALGAVPVGLPVTQLVESMSRNVVDGAILNWTSLVPFRVDQTARYHFDADLGVLPLAIVMNKDVYESLTGESKAAIDKSPQLLNAIAAEAFETVRRVFIERYSAEAGRTVVEPSGAEQQALEELFQSVYAEVEESDNAAVLESLRAQLNSLRN